MSYVLNQYNQPVVDSSDPSSSVNRTYMTLLTGGTPLRKSSSIDSGITGNANDLFYDECIKFNNSLSGGMNYYFHCKVKRLLSDQIFYVYLLNYNDTEEEAKTQYLKTITVTGGDPNEWVDFELIFSPLLDFDTILFQLQRTIDDYRIGTRYPVFCYEEISLINNLILNKINSGIGLIKMGIQSRPGLMTCLNGEEIHVGRSGVYEVRNGIVAVDFLSIINAATVNINGVNPLIDPRTGQVVTIEEYLNYIASLPDVEGKDNTNSKCIFDNSKLRKVDAFTLDYMYEEE